MKSCSAAIHVLTASSERSRTYSIYTFVSSTHTHMHAARYASRTWRLCALWYSFQQNVFHRLCVASSYNRKQTANASIEKKMCIFESILCEANIKVVHEPRQRELLSLIGQHSTKFWISFTYLAEIESTSFSSVKVNWSGVMGFLFFYRPHSQHKIYLVNFRDDRHRGSRHITINI